MTRTPVPGREMACRRDQEHMVVARLVRPWHFTLASH